MLWNNPDPRKQQTTKIHANRNTGIHDMKQRIVIRLHLRHKLHGIRGGCVRDSLLGRTPGDWDICTSARPEQVRTVFSAYRQILTGEKHGTVAVIVGGTPYEITT